MKDHNNNANQIEYLRRPGSIHISNIANNNQNSSKLNKISETLHEKYPMQHSAFSIFFIALNVTLID